MYIHTVTHTLTAHICTHNVYTEHAHICILTLHGNALSNGRETKNAKLLPVKKRVKNLAQQKAPDGSEMKKGTGNWVSRVRAGKSSDPNLQRH